MFGTGSALKRTLTRRVLRRALVVTVVVGTLVNLINRCDLLLAGAPLDGLKLTLTYCVPFCVSLHGAYSALRHSI